MSVSDQISHALQCQSLLRNHSVITLGFLKECDRLHHTLDATATRPMVTTATGYVCLDAEAVYRVRGGSQNAPRRAPAIT